MVHEGNGEAMMKKLLIYSHDTFGLGYIRRTLEIANQVWEIYQCPPPSFGGSVA